MQPSYGTNTSSPHRQRQDGTGNTETNGLLGRSKSRSSNDIAARLYTHFGSNVSRRHGDWVLLFCYTVTGLLDSTAIQVWGSFVSMQTGNTIYFFTGVTHPADGDKWLRALTSILCFCLGSLLFSNYHRYIGSSKRWALVSSYLVQLLFVLVAALLSTFPTTQNHPSTSYVSLAFLAFQASGQAVVSRVLGYGSLTSVVLTSIYCDLFSDQRLFVSFMDNPDRNQRVAAPLLLGLGAAMGGLLGSGEAGLESALWLAVGLKGVLVLAWLFWPSEEADDNDEGES